MLSMPCIATMLELNVGEDGELCSKGRVLVQNHLSRAYWGKLSIEVEDGKGSAQSITLLLLPGLG